MKKGSISSLRRELEDKFFLEQDMKLLEALRQETASKEKRQALADALGVCDEGLIEQLIEIEVSHETMAALSLIPLIAVAWADGSIDISERKAILEAAEKRGVDKDHAAYGLLECWLKKQPEDKLFAIWKEYASVLAQKMDEATRVTLKEGLLGRARTVAEAAGGILGLGNKISTSEQEVLDELDKAFG